MVAPAATADVELNRRSLNDLAATDVRIVLPGTAARGWKAAPTPSASRITPPTRRSGASRGTQGAPAASRDGTGRARCQWRPDHCRHTGRSPAPGRNPERDTPPIPSRGFAAVRQRRPGTRPPRPRHHHGLHGTERPPHRGPSSGPGGSGREASRRSAEIDVWRCRFWANYLRQDQPHGCPRSLTAERRLAHDSVTSGNKPGSRPLRRSRTWTG